MVVEPITIREAIPDDMPFLRKMMWEAISASPTLIAHLGEEAIQQRESTYWNGWVARPDPAFVAINADGRAIAAIVLQRDKPGKSGWRIGIGVEPDMRGKGTGTRLIQQALSFARADGATHIILGVDPENTRASALYANLGFVAVGSRNDLIEMRIDLTG